MKSHLIKLAASALVFLVLFIDPAQAKKKILIVGVKANMGLSKSTETIFDNKLSFHYAYGGLVNYNLMPFLGIETGLQKSRSGFAEDLTITNELGDYVTTAKISYQYNYLIVPAYLRLRFLGLYATGGVNIAFNTDNVATSNSTALPRDFLNELEYVNDVKRTNVDLHLGLGYQIMFFKRIGFFLEAGYNRQLDSLIDIPELSEVRLYNITVGGGLVVSLINK